MLTLGRSGQGPALSVRTGQTVTVTVLGTQTRGRWLVSVRGIPYVARSTVPLEVGSTHTAQVSLSRHGLTLRLTDAPADLAQMLREVNLPTDVLGLETARALMRAGLGVTAERMERIRAAFRTASEEGLSRKLRAGAEILKKMPDVSPADLSLLSAVFSGSGDRGGKGGRQGGGRDPRKDPDAEDVRSGLLGQQETRQQASREADLLRLFNHVGVPGETWVVLPCRFRMAGGTVVQGSVRLLLDTGSGAVRSVVVEASREGEPCWWFHLSPASGGDVCRVWRDGQPPSVEHRKALEAQLGKTGVRIADTLGDGARFDGFSPVERLPGPIDLLG